MSRGATLARMKMSFGRACGINSLRLFSREVVEYGGSQGVADAEVTLERYSGPAVSSFVERTSAGTAKTGADGLFVFSPESPGTYRLTVAKEGYGSSGGMLNPGNWTSTELSLDAERPTGKVRFVLARPGEIAGRVVDRETQRPLAGMRVVAWEYGFVRGHAWYMPAGEEVTDADGRFTVSKLSPTDYIIAVEPRIRAPQSLKRNPALQSEPRTLTEFSGQDLKTVDYDYNLTYWPGGADATDAVPVPLGSGASLNIGTLAVSKVPKYRVRVSFTGEPCLPNERSLLYVMARSVPIMAENAGSVACGRDVLIRGFAPGTYQLEAGEGSDTRGWLPFTIVDENLSISVPLSRGVDLDGKVLVPDGKTKPDLRGTKVLLSPTYRHVQNDPGIPDATGHFVIHKVLAREFELKVSGLPTTHYVKEVRYNGRRLAEDAFTVDEHAPAQLLELILGEDPATVGGTVTEDGKPVSRAYVVLARWPPNNREPFSSVSGTRTDERGRFQFAGLAGGDYRVLAVPGDDKAALERPNMLGRLLGDAEKLSLGARQYQNVSLTLIRP
jgi:hypothetical protein